MAGYPLRFDISQPGAAQPVDPILAAGQRARGGVLDAIMHAPGDAFQAISSVFPSLHALPVLVSQPVRSVAARFAQGVSGDPAAPQPTASAPSATPAKPATPAAGPSSDAVSKVLAATTAGKRPPTPQERVLAYIDSAFRQPLTPAQAAQVAGLMPRPVTANDSVAGMIASTSQQLYAKQLADAQELAKNDPGAASKAVDSASQQFLRNLSIAKSGNPLNPAIAALYQAGALPDQGN